MADVLLRGDDFTTRNLERGVGLDEDPDAALRSGDKLVLQLQQGVRWASSKAMLFASRRSRRQRS